MPFKAVSGDEEFISFQMSDQAWKDLRSKSKRKDIKMPCCDSKAIPKQSKLGTRYFSHHLKQGCEYKTETPQHLAAKKIVYEACIASGWRASTEVGGSTPDGKRWIADVFAQKGNARVAFEIQWSWQHMDEFRSRQKIYRQSGVRGAWFFRLRKNDHYEENTRLALESTLDTPLFGIQEDNNTFVLPHASWVELHEFTMCLLSSEVGFWPRKGMPAEWRFYTSTDRCLECGNLTRNLVRLNAVDTIYKNRYGLERVVSITQDNEYALFKLARKFLPQDILKHRIGPWEYRVVDVMPFSNVNRSKMRELVNLCQHCKASRSFGEFYNYGEEELLFTHHSNVENIPIEQHEWFFKDKPIHFSASSKV